MMPQTPRPPFSRTTNAEILAEVDRVGAWFHVRKVQPIRARKLDRDETVQTLEGPVEAKAGAYLCRGESGELWSQSAVSLHERYVATDEIDVAGWRRFVPRPDAAGALAARIDHPFTVDALCGKLKGKAGDYLLKRFLDRDVALPADVWIVDGELFQATYARVAAEGESTREGVDQE